jgi:hypothetical protein
MHVQKVALCSWGDGPPLFPNVIHSKPAYGKVKDPFDTMGNIDFEALYS